MKMYQVSLPDEFAAFVDRAVAEGKFDSIDHLVLYAVAQVEDELRLDEAMTDEERDALQKAIRIGIDQSNRGQVAPLDMAALRERVKARLASEQKPAHAPGDVDRAGRG